MARTRSPNYPALSLPDAIGRVTMVYDKNHQAPLDKGALALSMGFNSLHGGSLTAISAARKYGLLELVDRDYRVSDAGVLIIRGEKGTAERAEALREALHGPAIFEVLLDRYGEQPVDPRSIQSFLETKHGFKPKAAEVASRNFVEGVQFVTEQVGEYNRAEKQPAPGPSEFAKAPVETAFFGGGASLSAPGPIVEQLRYRLSPNCAVLMSFDGPVTQEAISKLEKLLQESKDAYPAATTALAVSEHSEPSTEQES